MTPRLSLLQKGDTLVVMTSDDAPPVVQYVALDEARIAYAEHAPGSSGPPLVFLHGGGLDHRMWRSQLGVFGDHRALALDARGHGWTQASDAPFRYCDDVVAVLDALDIDDAVFIGVSMGGSTAVDVALEHPDRVTAVVSCGAGTSEPEFRDPWTLEVLAAWQRSAQEQNPEGWIAAFMRFAAGPQRSLEEVAPGVVAEIETMVRHTLGTHIIGPEGPATPTVATPVTGTWERLSELEIPVLGVGGRLDSEDHLRIVDKLVDAVPQGSAQMINGAAHYPNMERSEEFNAALLRFVENL